MLDLRERNRLANQLRREPEAKEIGSPYRIKLYVDARINGKTTEKALEIARVKPKYIK